MLLCKSCEDLSAPNCDSNHTYNSMISLGVKKFSGTTALSSCHPWGDFHGAASKGSALKGAAEKCAAALYRGENIAVRIFLAIDCSAIV
jgi:hypothetical protein